MSDVKTMRCHQPEDVKAFVGDDGIYVPGPVYGYHTMLISKELFIEAYNKWIKDASAIRSFNFGEDTADDWSE